MIALKVLDQSDQLRTICINPDHLISVHEEDSDVFITMNMVVDRSPLVYKSAEPYHATIARLA